MISGIRSVLFSTAALTLFVGAGRAHAQAGSDSTSQAQGTVTNQQPADTVSKSADKNNGAEMMSEVVVTATKRSLQVDAVPASITAIGGNTLQQGHLDRLEDLTGQVPALQVSVNNNEVALFLRGVGHPSYSPQSENSVALNQDGVYLSQDAEGLNAFFDVSRVEALEGPQGTLYGRNATGGVINVISNLPTSIPSGYIALTGANYARGDIDGVYSAPITDNLQFRIGGFEHRQFDGYGEDFTTHTPNQDLDERGGKLSLQYQPNDRLTLIFRGDGYYAKDHDTGYYYDGPSGQTPIEPIQSLGGLVTGSKFNTYDNVPDERDVKLGGASVEAQYHLNPNIVVKSITSYRTVDDTFTTDLDGSQLSLGALTVGAHAHHYSEELSSSITEGPLFINAGLYYFGQEVHSNVFSPLPLYYEFTSKGIPIPASIFHLPGAPGAFEQYANGRTNAEAAYANASYDVNSRLTFGVGLRYSNENKENEGAESQVVYPLVPVRVERSSNGLTPSFTATYKFNDDINAYATISRGYKGGEFIAGTTNYAKPEYLWDYEVGLKGHTSDRRLRFSLGAFYYDYQNLQIEIFQGVSGVLINAPSATDYGVEGTADVLLPLNIDLKTSLSGLHTRLGDVLTNDPNISGDPVTNLQGHQFPNAPTFQAHVSLSRRFEMGRWGYGVGVIDYAYQDDSYLDVFNVRDNEFQPAHSIVNASYLITLPGAKWSLLIWAKNITNVIVDNNEAVQNSLDNNREVNWSDPRTYGATIKYTF